MVGGVVLLQLTVYPLTTSPHANVPGFGLLPWLFPWLELLPGPVLAPWLELFVWLELLVPLWGGGGGGLFGACAGEALGFGLTTGTQ